MDNRTQFNPTRLQFICDETYLLPYFRPNKRDFLEAIIMHNKVAIFIGIFVKPKVTSFMLPSFTTMIFSI